MTTSAITIRPFTPTSTDYAGFASVTILANWNDPFFIALFPHKSEFAEDIERSIINFEKLRLPRKEFIAFVAEDGDKIVGTAIWAKVNAGEEVLNPFWKGGEVNERELEAEKERQRIERIENPNKAEAIGLREKIWAGMDHARSERLKGRTVWHLAFVAVLPDYQRRGIATRLLKEGMEKARVDKVPTYVEASEDGTALYGKLGWEVVGKIVEEDGEGGTLEAPVMTWYPEGMKEERRLEV